jgi:hypothetical protein
MGVTIHFEGRLKDVAAADRALAIASRFAVEAGWRSEPVNESEPIPCGAGDGNVPRLGLTLFPHEASEPLWLAFDGAGCVRQHIKTQYAPVTVHMKVVELLRLLAGEFESLDVDDEGEYWETSDRAILESRIDECAVALGEMLRQEPRARGPVRLPNGRIADYISEE